MKGTTSLIVLSTLLCQSILAFSNFERRDAPARISNNNTPPVSVKGNAFFVNNKRFYVRGVDYQPGGSSTNYDPIGHIADCTRDIDNFKKLGINTVRVYSVDNSLNHDDCMKLLADAGIYLALDVNTPVYSLNRENSYKIRMSYNDVYLQSLFATVDAFQKYDNTLLFYSANEVINDNATSFAAPYIKAVVRDLKQYIKARGYRTIPVGYSAADVDSNRFQTAQYLNCGDDSVRSDFFAFNDYSWCDPSDFHTSQWDQKVQQYSSYSIPIFLSEYGCHTNKRDFGEVASLYSSNMTKVYSGGLVYEYSQEENKFGLVVIDKSNSSVTPLPDFNTLVKAFAKTPNPTDDGGYKSDGNPSTCPPQSLPFWVVSNSSLPIIPQGALKFMTDGAGPPPGNANTQGSQWAGTPSVGFGPGSGSGNGSAAAKKSAGTAEPRPVLTIVAFVVAAMFALLSL